MQLRSLGWEDLQKKGMATHSSILAWRIPWTECLAGYSPQSHKESDTTGATENACIAFTKHFQVYYNICFLPQSSEFGFAIPTLEMMKLRQAGFKHFPTVMQSRSSQLKLLSPTLAALSRMAKHTRSQKSLKVKFILKLVIFLSASPLQMEKSTGRNCS